MKKILIAVAAIAVLALLTSFAFPQTAPTTCSSEPPPLPTYTELDPNPARYTGPACLEGEECTTPADWHEAPGYVLTAEGARITYTDTGTLYTHLCPNKIDHWFEEDQWVKDPEKCWIRKPVKISECP